VSDNEDGTDLVQLVGVLGLSVVAVTVLAFSGFLAIRGIEVPGAWESLAGAAVGSLGTLIVTKRTKEATPTIQERPPPGPSWLKE